MMWEGGDVISSDAVCTLIGGGGSQGATAGLNPLRISVVLQFLYFLLKC